VLLFIVKLLLMAYTFRVNHPIKDAAARRVGWQSHFVSGGRVGGRHLSGHPIKINFRAAGKVGSARRHGEVELHRHSIRGRQPFIGVNVARVADCSPDAFAGWQLADNRHHRLSRLPTN
jgi:hypothetical protein